MTDKKDIIKQKLYGNHLIFFSLRLRAGKKRRQATIAAIKHFRQGNNLMGLCIKSLIEEGCR